MRDLSSILRDGPASSGLERFCVAICHDVRAPVATAGAAIQRLATLAPPGRAPSTDARAPGAEGSPIDGVRAFGIGAASNATFAPGNEEQARLLAIARASLAKAEDLLASLPDLLAAERRACLAPVALEDAVRDARRDVELELDLVGAAVLVEGRLGSVLAHPERLRIALRNLLRNAVRYRRSAPPLEIRLRAFARGPWRTLVVADNGIGIARAAQARIFAPLERLGRDGGAGSGIGLTLVRHAIEACGGTIAVRSRPGRGASFALTLRAAGSGGEASRS